jgi:SAM-dependent methyltransferase
MTYEQTFEELLQQAIDALFEGWDFSWLEGRRTELDLPWDYVAIVKERMKHVESMLDMGTGGGEILSEMQPFPPRACATESYPPNVPVARNRLTPLGVDVRDTRDDPDNKHLPFGGAEFDLVINKHESFMPSEVRRILKPGGRFITQQCDGYGDMDLIRFFKEDVKTMHWTLYVAVRQLEDAGFEVIDQRQYGAEYEFFDVGAIVYTFRTMPWYLGDFSVEKYRDRLLAMHEQIQKNGSFKVWDQRFFIQAVKI